MEIRSGGGRGEGGGGGGRKREGEGGGGLASLPVSKCFSAWVSVGHDNIHDGTETRSSKFPPVLWSRTGH